MKRLFIISTKAGSFHQSPYLKDLREFAKEVKEEIDFRIVETQTADDARRIAKDFVEEAGDDKIVYCCGGDGTLNEIAQVVAGSTTALGLLPTGTANDFSKNFDYRKFKIQDTLNPTIQPIDMIRVNDQKAINIMSMGFDTMILKRTYALLEKMRFLKSRAFILAATYSVLKLETEYLKLRVKEISGDWLNLEGDYNIIALCNGGFYGNGFHPSPHANLKDGVLELILAEKLGFFEFLGLIKQYKDGLHLRNPKIRLIRLTEGIIDTNRNTPANCDGHLFETNHFHFEILKNELRWAFIAPPIEV